MDPSQRPRLWSGALATVHSAHGALPAPPGSPTPGPPGPFPLSCRSPSTAPCTAPRTAPTTAPTRPAIVSATVHHATSPLAHCPLRCSAALQFVLQYCSPAAIPRPGTEVVLHLYSCAAPLLGSLQVMLHLCSSAALHLCCSPCSAAPWLSSSAALVLQMAQLFCRCSCALGVGAVRFVRYSPLARRAVIAAVAFCCSWTSVPLPAVPLAGCLGVVVRVLAWRVGTGLSP